MFSPWTKMKVDYYLQCLHLFSTTFLIPSSLHFTNINNHIPGCFHWQSLSWKLGAETRERTHHCVAQMCKWLSLWIDWSVLWMTHLFLTSKARTNYSTGFPVTFWAGWYLGNAPKQKLLSLMLSNFGRREILWQCTVCRTYYMGI